MTTRIKAALAIILIFFVITTLDYFTSLYFETFEGHPQDEVWQGLLFAAIFFFVVGSFAAIVVYDLVVRYYRKIEEHNLNLEKVNESILTQAFLSHEVRERIEIMLNSSPLACQLWNKEFKVFECNDAAIKLLNFKDKQECFDRYFDASPEYQPDGQRSRDKTIGLLKRAFRGERCIVEWIHQLPDGTPLPTEITFIRVYYHDNYAVAAYAQDLREHKRMMQDIEQRESLLNTVNQATTLLLTATDENKFEELLLESLTLIGYHSRVDRVQLWQNEMIDNTHYFVLKYRWLSEVGKEKTGPPLDTPMPYSLCPGWEEQFSRGEYINEPLRNLSPDIQSVLHGFDIKTLVIIPLFLENRFWGFLSLDDCRQERTLTNDEIDILDSAGLMMISTVNRQLLLEKIREEHKYANLLLDAMPFGCCLWNRELNIIDCNDEVVRLVGLKTQEEFLDRFNELSPKRQADGSLSSEYSKMYIRKAFDKGRCVVEWTHQTVDGTPIPVETVLVRVPYGNDTIVAGYLRDLREHQQMMEKIERRDALLNVMNRVAAILLQSETDAFENNLYLCMNMIAEALDVDRVSIWKNHSIDGTLYHKKLYEWRSPEAQRYSADQTETFQPEDVSYEEQALGWEEILSRVDCVAGLVRNMSSAAQKLLGEQHIVSLCVVPIFCHEEFWGIIRYDNYRQEHIYSESEQLILRSGGMLIANAMLRNDMTENLRSSAEQLESALQDAQTANQAKSIFLARMSHEMRTPLNAVIGLCGLTLENDSLDHESQTSLEKVYNAGVMLLNTVNDILDISKLEAGKYDLQPAEYELASLINDTITQNYLRIGTKPIELFLEINENLPKKLYGDELRVKQIINNLLSNAFKYTMEGTVVLSVVCTREGDDMWLDISTQDTGIGIRSEDIPHLFSDYTRVDKNVTRFVEGTGLGLSLTEKMVEIMGGTINVESEYGKGSTFTVKLRQQFVSDDVIGPEMVNNLKNFQKTVIGKYDRNSGVVRTKMPYAHVLLVDDNLTNLDVAQGMMRPYALKIDCLTSGQQAVDAVREEKSRYNAIFMDHMMPDMDGIEAARLIRTIDTEYARTVPIIALTANAVVGNEQMFLSNGFQAFLSKPIEVPRLDEVLQRWVRDEEQDKWLADQLAGQAVTNRRGGQRDRRSWVDRRLIGEGISGVDMNKGIERFGDRETFNEVLRSFVVHTRPLLATVKEVHENTLTDYAIIVHGIKGACRGICAESVGTLASILEEASKKGDFELVNKHNSDFIKALFKLLTDIENTLAETDTKVQKPKKDKPDAAILAELLSACNNYDMDGVDAAMEKIAGYAYTSDDGLTDWLRENVEQMNFTEIKDRLTALLE